MFEPTKRKVAMISLPMKDRAREEILNSWNRVKYKLEMRGYIVVDTVFPQSYVELDEPLFMLSLAINKMSDCDTVYFCKGWEQARGCRCEHLIADTYGLNIIYEDGEESEDEEVLSDEQLAFMTGLDHAEEVLEEYFDLVQNAWSGCAEEYKRSAKILKNGAIRWVHGAQFQKAAEFLEGAEVE